MPTLLKDPKVPHLYQDPKTSVYYVRRYVVGKGELCLSLREKNRHKAIKKKNQVEAYWIGEKSKHKVLFETVALELLEIRKMQAAKTFIDYAGHLEKMLPYFEGTPVEDVHKLWPQYKSYQRGLNPKRKLKHDRKHLRAILGHAHLNGIISGIPALPLERGDLAVGKAQEFTNEEYLALKERANFKWGLIIDLAILMGMRRREISLLRFEYIDWVRRLIILPESVTKIREEAAIPIEDSVFDRLMELSRKAKSPYVFPHRTRPFEPMTPTDKTWQRLKKSLGIKKKFHWSRVTFATRAIREGAPDALVQQAARMSDRVMKQVYLQKNLEDVRETHRAVKRSLKS